MNVHDEYRCDDRSLALRWLATRLFMPMVRVLPRRFTPNQVTLAGHLCLWSSAALALTWSRGETVALLALALGYTAYNVTDTIDGMYARHSRQTSRVGELLDHGLDAFGMPLVPLTYGIVFREPAWLVLGSTATVGYVQFLTFLHGYRVGFVVLGEIGVIEGLAIAAAVCAAAALGGWPLLTRTLFNDVSPAGLLAIAFIAAAVPAVLSMRGLLRHPADLIPPAILVALVLAWYGFGRLALPVAGLLILFTCAFETMLVTSARLRRLGLALWDLPFAAALAAAALASTALRLGARTQTVLAGVLIAYALNRSALLFARTMAATRRL